MKKMLATLKIIISILLLILLMAACSSTTTEPGNTTSESDTETTTETEDSTSAEPMAESRTDYGNTGWIRPTVRFAPGGVDGSGSEIFRSGSARVQLYLTFTRQ